MALTAVAFDSRCTSASPEELLKQRCLHQDEMSPDSRGGARALMVCINSPGDSR